MSTSESSPLILAITACPTGIAHTYMAAENLEAAAQELGYRIKIETHGSIGVEGTFSKQDIEDADAIVIGADTVISKDRFHGKRLEATGVDEAIKHPKELLSRSLSAARWEGSTDSQEEEAPRKNSIGQTLYKALMNGVSHMIPFVVTGGLLIAVALSIGGTPTPEGMAIPEDSFWNTVNELGALAFSLMVPVLSGYIAVGIADRPGLAPGLITGLIATTGSLYGSETGAGFLGGIVTGILSGYVALAIKKIPVHKFIAPIWPIIVIPIFTTLIVGLIFILLIGAPVSAAFETMTEYLAGMQGSSVIVLGLILGAMIAFDMGGPFNKTCLLYTSPSPRDKRQSRMPSTSRPTCVAPLPDAPPFAPRRSSWHDFLTGSAILVGQLQEHLVERRPAKRDVEDAHTFGAKRRRDGDDSVEFSRRLDDEDRTRLRRRRGVEEFVAGQRGPYPCHIGCVEQRDLADRRSRLMFELLGGSASDHRAVIKHDDIVGETIGLFEVLRREQHGDALGS